MKTQKYDRYEVLSIHTELSIDTHRVDLGTIVAVQRWNDSSTYPFVHTMIHCTSDPSCSSTTYLEPKINKIDELTKF